MIDHVGFEVSDLARSARFYDAVFFALGVRRMHEGRAAIAYGSRRAALLDRRARPRARRRATATSRSRRPAGPRSTPPTRPAWRRRARRRADGAPGPRPQYGPRYYAAYLLDPDGLRVEVVTGGH